MAQEVWQVCLLCIAQQGAGWMLGCHVLHPSMLLLRLQSLSQQALCLQVLEPWAAEAQAASVAKSYSSIVPGWAGMQEAIAGSMQLLSQAAASQAGADAQQPSSRQDAGAACEAVVRAVQLWAQGVHTASGTLCAGPVVLCHPLQRLQAPGSMQPPRLPAAL